jgi:site-specific recombinase XerD
MKDLTLKELIKAFVDSLSSEKGYSVNTCRAYQEGLEGVLSLFEN